MTDPTDAPSWLLTPSSQDAIGDTGNRRFMMIKLVPTEDVLCVHRKYLIEQVARTFGVPAHLLKKD